MNTENMIDITGASLTEVAKAAYSLSVPQGMGFIHAQPGPLSDGAAQALVNEYKDDKRIALSMDYVQGRACKLTVFRDGDKLYIPNSWYDHSEATHERLVEMLIESMVKETA